MKHFTKYLLIGSLGLGILVNHTSQNVAARPSILDSGSQDSVMESQSSSLTSNDSESMTFPELQAKLEQARQTVLSAKLSMTFSQKNKAMSRPIKQEVVTWNKFENDREPKLAFNHEKVNFNDLLEFEYFITKDSQSSYRVYEKEASGKPTYRTTEIPFAWLNYQEILSALIRLEAPNAKVEMKDSSYHVYISDSDTSLANLYALRLEGDKKGIENSKMELVFDQKDLHLKAVTFQYEDDENWRSAQLTIEDINQVSDKDLSLASWTAEAQEYEESSESSETSNDSQASDESSERSETKSTASKIVEEMTQKPVLSSVFMSYESASMSDDKTSIKALEGDMAYDKQGKISGLHFYAIMEPTLPDGRFMEVAKSLGDDLVYGRFNSQWYKVPADQIGDTNPEYQQLLSALADESLTKQMTVEESDNTYTLSLESKKLDSIRYLARKMLMDFVESDKQEANFSLTIEVSKKDYYLKSLTLKIQTKGGVNSHNDYARVSFNRHNAVPDKHFELPKDTQNARPIEELSSSQESNW